MIPQPGGPKGPADTRICVYIYIWLRLFCFVFFRACPGQLLVNAICKEGSPENRGKKVALVSPAMEIRTKT